MHRLIVLAGVTVVAPFAFAASPPATPLKAVTDTYHGTTVTDPYRWLEDGEAAEVKAWSDAESLHARSVLDALPHVSDIRARVTAILSAPTIAYGGVVVVAEKLFALK